MSEQSKKPGNEPDMFVIIVGGILALFAVAFALPLLAGVGIFLGLRALKFSPPKYFLVGVIFTTGVVAVLHRKEMYSQYTSWVRNLLTGGIVPSLYVAGAIALWAVMWAAVFLLFGSSFETSSVGDFFRRLFKKESLLDTPNVIPTDEEFKKLSEGDFSRLSGGADTEGNEPSFVMGVNKEGKEVRITEKQIGMHMLAFGGTGSGKTVSLQVIAGGLLDLGWDGILLDLKEDTGAGGLRDWCNEYAEAHRIEYQELALSTDSPKATFDPLFGLNADEARDTILSLTRFDDEYYKNVSIKVLGQTLKLLYWAHEAAPHLYDRPNLSMLASYMSEADLAKALRPILNVVVGYDETVKKNGKVVGKQHIQGLMEPQVTLDDFDILRANQTDKVYQQQANSWGAKIGNLYETQAGRTILRPNPNLPDMDVTKGGLTYIGLDSTSKLDLSKVISASVLQRIATDAAQRTHGKITTEARKKFIIIDEASIVDRTIVHALLSKARSAGVAVILATQGPRDWMDRDGDDFSKLSQNTNVALIMNQGEPESAHICAEYIGKHNVVQANLRYADGALDDAGSVRETEDYIVRPDALRQLGIGQGVLRVGKPETTVSYVKVIPRDPAGHAGGSKPSAAPSSPNPFGGTMPNVPTGVPRPPRS